MTTGEYGPRAPHLEQRLCEATGQEVGLLILADRVDSDQCDLAVTTPDMIGLGYRFLSRVLSLVRRPLH